MTNSKIQILYDPQGLEDNEDQSITVENVSDYVKTYKLISDCLSKSKQAKIIVKNPTVFFWLSQLNEKYSQETIEISELKPRRLLAERWEFNIPDDVRDEEIIELNLLSFAPDKNSGDFNSFILSRFISPIMNTETIPIQNISVLASALSNEDVKRNLNKPLVLREFTKKIEIWMKNAKSQYEKEIADLLSQNTQDLRILLSQYAILANYPDELGERTIGPNFQTFRKLGLIPKNLDINHETIQTVTTNIEIFLNSRFNNNISPTDASLIVNWSSGLIPEEFLIIKNKLKEHPSTISTELLRQIEEKFSVVLHLIQPEMRKLRQLVRPNYPSDPDDKWEASKMLEWATQQYLPYRFWLEENDEEDPQISKKCEAFGDWLHSNFVDLRSNFPMVAYRILPYIIAMNSNDKILLTVVIDNFNYKFAEMLETFMQNNGFSLVQKQPYFSMIPSDTETSKRCLFAGQPKVTDTDQLADYETLLLKEWQDSFPERKFSYLKSTLDLEEAKASSGDVILVNCLQIDYALHQDEKKLGKRHALQIETELKNITNLITEFCHRNNLTKNVTVVICSDHGCTQIPNSSPNEIDPAFFVGKNIDTHHRFVTISKAEYDRLPDNIKKYQAYFLESSIFGLPQNVLIARGYYRFKRTNDRFYVHGGLSPEETVLPLLIFKSGKTDIKKPILHLLKNEFRYLTKAILEIEIINENSSPIEDVQLSVTPNAAELEVVEPAQKIEKIDPANLSKTKFALRFYREFDPTQGIEVVIEFKLLGKLYTERQRLPVQMKSTMETSFKL